MFSNNTTRFPQTFIIWFGLAILVVMHNFTDNVPAKRYGLVETVASLEESIGARIGVAVTDTHTGRRWEHRASERFPMNSTFKTLACAAVLKRSDANTERLDRIIKYRESDLVAYSPVLKSRSGEHGMSLEELCDATMSLSDNTAANLILDAIGGPEGLTSFIRAIGDDITRLDRYETALNEATPGDFRDTTTPMAMATTVQELVLGDILSRNSRNQLIDWLKSNSISADMLRAAIPDSWEIGDRTGAGGFGSRSISAVIWPPNRRAIVASIYITETEASFGERNAAIKAIGRAIVAEISRHSTYERSLAEQRLELIERR